MVKNEVNFKDFVLKIFGQNFSVRPKRISIDWLGGGWTTRKLGVDYVRRDNASCRRFCLVIADIVGSGCQLSDHWLVACWVVGFTIYSLAFTYPASWTILRRKSYRCSSTITKAADYVITAHTSLRSGVRVTTYDTNKNNIKSYQTDAPSNE